MDLRKVWESKIAALSAILGLDIFVSAFHNRTEEMLGWAIWYRYHNTHGGFTRGVVLYGPEGPSAQNFCAPPR